MKSGRLEELYVLYKKENFELDCDILFKINYTSLRSIFFRRFELESIINVSFILNLGAWIDSKRKRIILFPKINPRRSITKEWIVNEFTFSHKLFSSLRNRRFRRNKDIPTSFCHHLGGRLSRRVPFPPISLPQIG